MVAGRFARVHRTLDSIRHSFYEQLRFVANLLGELASGRNHKYRRLARLRFAFYASQRLNSGNQKRESLSRSSFRTR